MCKAVGDNGNNLFTVVLECEQINLHDDDAGSDIFYSARPFKGEYRLYLDEDQASSAWDVFAAFKRIFLVLGFAENTWNDFVSDKVNIEG